jgi:hypothetical protein
MDRELEWRATCAGTSQPGGARRLHQSLALGVDEQRTNVVIDIDAPLEARSALGDAYRVDSRDAVETDDDLMMVPTTALFS